MTAHAEEVRALAADWRSRVGAIADDMYAALAGRIPVAASDPELAVLTRASCTSNIETIVSMLDSGIPVQAAEAPVTALEHARLMAQRGAEVDDTLRFYRLGQGYFMRRWAEDLQRAGHDAPRLLAAIDEAAAFMVEYIDIVSTRVSAEHLAERERRQRRAAVMRADVVRALLQEEAVDLVAAQHTLGHRLDARQLAFVCWSTRPTGQLERTAFAVAEAAGSSRPLLVPDGPRTILGWLDRTDERRVDEDAVQRVLDGLEPAISVAFGRVCQGVEGFRASRDQADRARRVAELLESDAPRYVSFADVSMLDLLSRDMDTAGAFVRAELNTLASAEPATAAIRLTLLTVLKPRGAIAEAARTLDLHRNTVLQRIRRAEAMRGRNIQERPDELYLALLLVDRFPSLAR